MLEVLSATNAFDAYRLVQKDTLLGAKRLVYKTSLLRMLYVLEELQGFS